MKLTPSLPVLATLVTLAAPAVAAEKKPIILDLSQMGENTHICIENICRDLAPINVNMLSRSRLNPDTGEGVTDGIRRVFSPDHSSQIRVEALRKIASPMSLDAHRVSFFVNLNKLLSDEERSDLENGGTPERVLGLIAKKIEKVANRLAFSSENGHEEAYHIDFTFDKKLFASDH